MTLRNVHTSLIRATRKDGHVRETGPKGCLLVSVEEGRLAGVEFRATDVVRWHWPEITLAAQDGLPELYAAVREQLERCQTESDGRFAAVRLTIAGRCAAHNALLDGATRARPLPKSAIRQTS